MQGYPLLKKFLIGLAKVLCSVALVVWLLRDALVKDPEALSNLRGGEKNWWLLAAALGVCSLTVVILTIRWYFLVRALGIPCRLRDIFRISLVGYLFNLAPMGVVGGDLLKTVMLAREQHGYRAESVASVAVDRLVGLYMLFVVASVAILATGFLGTSSADLRTIARATLVITAVGTVAAVSVLAPEAMVGRMVRLLGKIPYVGSPLERVVVAVRLYRHKLAVLAGAAILSVAVHLTFITAIHLIAMGLPDTALSYPMHTVVAPLSAATSVIPLPAGPQEGALKFFYDKLAQAPLKGLVVSLVYRIITVLIAAVGVGYYLTSRREVAEVLHEAEEAPTDDPTALSQPVA